MPDVYRIARAAPDHLREIPKIEQAAASVFAAEDLPPSLRYRVTDPQYVDDAQRDGRLWVALAGTHPVGFALADVADGEAYLSEIDVHPDHARQGLGTRLVHAVVDWAAAHRFACVRLVTFRHLPWNAPFYARLGFVALPEQEVGPELREFIEEEREAGIDTGKRVAMRLALPQAPRGEGA
ncbi:MAG TPA: GNAT family N-acetyltransferase [Woeseiaceae bacterium]|nr:GNAT family N-acetyltransferase [Woeseiaceae bacterium]